MSSIFRSQFARHLTAFLTFKRDRGYRYERAEFMLRSFDKFVAQLKRGQVVELDAAILGWLGGRPHRKPVSISMDLIVLREFWRYMRRCNPRRYAREPHWPHLPTEPDFVARILSHEDIRLLLRQIKQLGRPRFRSALYRALFLVLYCTGLRIGEALRLRIRDVDLRRRTLYIFESKGRSRWTPFHASLGIELRRYLHAREKFIGHATSPTDHVFVSVSGNGLSKSTAAGTICKLFRDVGLKPDRGRIGPRTHDIRHTFAVHRLTRWYKQRVDLQERLPWLSAYLGHVDLLGTETYLNATPELLALAGDRFRRRFAEGRIP